MVLVAALSAGCEQASTEVVFQGEIVDFALEPHNAANLCKGNAPLLDAAAVAMAERLGIDNPPRITYQWLPDGLDDTPCTAWGIGGCADGRDIYVRFPFAEHEIAHALVSGWGRSDPFLEEGLAELLGGASLRSVYGDPDALIGRQQQLLQPTHYPTAGRFVAEAVDIASMADFEALYRAVDYRDPPEVVRQHVRTRMGLTVEQIGESMNAQPACGSSVYRFNPVHCAMPPTLLPPEDDEVVKLESGLECDSEGVWGSEAHRQTARTVQMQYTGSLDIVVNEGTVATLSGCSPRCEQGSAIEIRDDAGLSRVTVPWGRYVLLLRRRDPGPARVTFTGR